MRNLYERLELCHPKLSRGELWCKKCGKHIKIDPATCFSKGWPKCHEETMTLDSPEERKDYERNN